MDGRVLEIDTSIIQEIHINKIKLKIDIKQYSEVNMPIDLKQLYSRIREFNQLKDKNIPWERYFFPVHARKLNEVYHGNYICSSKEYSFIGSVLQLLICIEKKRRFPLLTPKHQFRFAFDDYGKNCALHSICTQYENFSGKFSFEKQSCYKFLKYFFSLTTVPICMQFTLDSLCLVFDERLKSVNHIQYCLQLNVSLYDKQLFPMSLRRLMRLVTYLCSMCLLSYLLCLH